jgi:hypothetical protein
MSKTVDTVAGPFTFNRAQKLRRAVQRAGGATVELEGESLELGFARYLLEFLESQFDLASEDE